MNKEDFINKVEAVNLSRLHDWAVYTQGARMMLLKLREHLLCVESGYCFKHAPHMVRGEEIIRSNRRQIITYKQK